VIRYGDGSTATIVYTTMGSGTLPKERVEVYTGGACAVLDDYTSLKFYGARGKAWSGMQDKGHKALRDAMGKRLCAGEDMPIGLEASYQSHVLTFKALEAARTGAVIAL
ncbi:MAG: hypothetical protein QG656_1701, partial [Candidatus Hydrogenedentes bacterium]|nr:hypothetical protein [Candidatus Hydrogenedentota bacterium]